MKSLLHCLLLALSLLVNMYPMIEADTYTYGYGDYSKPEQKSPGSASYILKLKMQALNSLAQASASKISSASKSSSAGSSSTHKPYGYYYNYGVPSDTSSSKKSIIKIVLDAVRAITGGVTSLKGQLIKGSGYALGASGKLVVGYGDKITDAGRTMINSAQSKPYGKPSTGSSVFSKFVSLSGASSGPTKESEPTYGVPNDYAAPPPPNKVQYLPPPSEINDGSYSYQNSHDFAFEAPIANYLTDAYGINGYNDFNVFRGPQKLSNIETSKATLQLEEILSLLPDDNEEYINTKTTITLKPSLFDIYEDSLKTDENNKLPFYKLPSELGSLESSVLHSESITTKPYGSKFSDKFLGDIYHQMQKQHQTAEEIYLAKHPNEIIDYQSPCKEHIKDTNYKYDNYHVTGINNNSNILNDLKPILDILEDNRNNKQINNQESISYALTNDHKPKTSFQTLENILKPRTRYIFYPPVTSKYLSVLNIKNEKKSHQPYEIRRRAAVIEQPKLKIDDIENFNSLLYSAGLTTDL